MSRNQIIEHLSTNVAMSPFDIKWLPSTARFLVVGETAKAEGRLQLYDLEQDGISQHSTHPHKVGVKCIAVGSSDSVTTSVAFGDFCGSVSMIDMDTFDESWTIPTAHSKIVNCIDSCGAAIGGFGALELVTGSRDGTVKVWDPRTAEPVVTLDPSGQGVDCWTVCFGNAFSDSDRCIVAGYDNGDIKLLDLRTMTIGWEHNVKNGVCHVSFDRKDIAMNKLSVSCLESQLHVFDMRTYHPKSGYAGLSHSVGRSTVWGCHYLPQNRDVMAVTSGNGSISMFKYDYPMERKVKDHDGIYHGIAGTLEPLAQEDNISNQPIMALDWHPGKKGLCAVASFDQTARVVIVTNLD